MSVVSFMFSAEDCVVFDTLNKHCQRLKSQLEQKQVWTGTIACVSDNRKDIIIYNVFSNSTSQTISLSQTIDHVIHNRDELIVWPDVPLYQVISVNLITYKTEKRLRVDFSDIWCVKPFSDGTIAIGLDNELLIFKDWKKQYSIRAKMAHDAILMQNGDICTAHNYSANRKIVIWKNATACTKYKLGPCSSLLEYTPGTIVSLHEDKIFYIQSNEWKSTTAPSCLLANSLLKIKNGTFVVASAENNDIYVYDGQVLRYTISEKRERYIGSKILLVQPGIISWQNDYLIVYDVEKRKVIGEYKCPGEAVFF